MSSGYGAELETFPRRHIAAHQSCKVDRQLTPSFLADSFATPIPAISSFEFLLCRYLRRERS
jgi:hypothetical protein